MDAIPLLTLKRLPKYLDVLYRFKKAGLKMVSATKIAVFTDVHMTQVRKDLSFTGVVGTPKIGHNIEQLIIAIENCLNWNDISSCFLVGVGHLGKALMGYQELHKKGLRIIAAFDTNPALSDTYYQGIPIHSMEKFSNLLSRLHVHIGILTVPADAAQGIADQMVENGVLAIWNFTPAKLILPEDIIVENVDMSSSLAVLSRRIAERLHIDKA
ncbi:MAG: redox-sensing transcriptional repressor Rex [Candidatus Cloacimonadales bacterium]|jgi:redox-sensing transcriptional repressor|nr:redox-sensing transcriptional repressor Rex [Candidatus Cloacimonadota bacterium]MDY0380605.1 redox-sensing transcriptional repressor Rex [Candidatus Cloacimonadaceae bacterium]MCB5263932.1 redox-sensing transcriptional repressor Rex [Candidatus Cloacimonadota bacterium]MCB5276597.1 redox-sensing transcriptional repressor Rex [Candidatus Cloacimonadota bacterium]MCK9434123.1 redox-sensing transcriptional repressor Rex [Candidatus Cloacimonadota bacterium]